MNISERIEAYILMVLVVCAPGPARAVSYPLIEEQREEKAAKGISEKGEAVCLFQSGTAEVRKELHPGDVLSVYREERNRQAREVCKIRYSPMREKIT